MTFFQMVHKKYNRVVCNSSLLQVCFLLILFVSGTFAQELSLLFQMIGGSSGCNYYSHGEGGHPVSEQDRPQLTIEYSTSGGVDKTLVLRYGVDDYNSGVGCTIMAAYPDENLVDPPNSNPGGEAPEKEGYIKNKADTQRRGLVQFDLSGIPAGATIKSAHLRLVTEATEGYGSNTTGNIHVWLLKSSFDVHEVTYNSRKEGVAWETPGGELDEELFVFPMVGNSNIVGTKPGVHTMRALGPTIQSIVPQVSTLKMIKFSKRSLSGSEVYDIMGRLINTQKIVSPWMIKVPMLSTDQ
ncbi:MAG: DNRLRE domain-containing protein [Fibrobacteria bacterium]|nr:DNRLRE domain-containing protein [Fibrobacteria bacterium]